MDLPSYTKEQFKEWLYDNNFKRTFTIVGQKVDTKKELKPSADRKDDFLPYAINNITLVRWEENKKHQFNDILNGFGKGKLRCKPVLQLDFNGNILAEYHSFSFAKRLVGYSMESNIKKWKTIKKRRNIFGGINER